MSVIIKKTLGSRAFDALNAAFLLLLMLAIILPFWVLLMRSLSASAAGASSSVLWPRTISMSNYVTVARNKFVWIGYMNTLIRTVCGTAAGVVFTAAGAYCLSRAHFPHRTFWTMFVVITMFIGGGMIPSYLLIVNLKLIDNRLSLILPGLIGTYNLVIMRNFFQQLPSELEDSARVDGANNLRILWSIYLPISLPIIATVSLWVAVGHWNAWFDQLLYIRDTDKFVLQVVLRRIVLEGTQQMMDSGSSQADYEINPEGVKSAVIFFTTLPILLAYPFAQKYFVKGVIVGSLKG